MSQYPDTIELNITQEHVDRATSKRKSGDYHTCSDCVVAQAWREIYPNGSVGFYRAFINTSTDRRVPTYQTSKELQNQIDSFDKNCKFVPGTYTLKKYVTPTF